MPDFGAPVAQNVDVNPTRGLQTLSGLLNIQAQRQGLVGQAAEVQQAQQTARQRSGIASFMSSFDPTQHIGSDGTLDLDSVLTDPKLRQSAGDQFPEVAKQMISIKQGQLTAKQQLANLNDSLRNQFSSTVGSLRTDPDVVQDNPRGRAKVQQAMGDFAQSGGPDAARVADIYRPVLQHTPQGKLSQTLSNFQLQAMDAGTQSGRQAPTLVGAGNRLVEANPQAAGGNLGAQGDISVGAPPGWQFDPVTKSWHPTAALGPGGGGAPNAPPQQSTAPPPPATTAPRPNVAGAPQYKPGEAATIEANTQAGGQRYNELVTAAADSPARANVLDNIIRLAGDPNAPRTGPGAGWKAAASTAIGQTTGFQGAKDDAAKYNELAKFLHQSALRAWQGAGGTGTNQQLSTIEGANPNVNQDPTTIVALAKYNKAGELALQAKATAHQTWMHQSGNNFANQSDFEQQWRQNFDPVLFQLKTASPEEAQRMLAGMKPEQLNELGRKQQWLRSEGVY